MTEMSRGILCLYIPSRQLHVTVVLLFYCLKNSVPLGQKFEMLTTREKIAEEFGESSSNVQRYIRLTELIPEILELVDELFGAEESILIGFLDI